MKPKQWLLTTRRCVCLPIAPYKIKCRACKGGWCDVKGEHQVVCAGLGSRRDTIPFVTFRPLRSEMQVMG